MQTDLLIIGKNALTEKSFDYKRLFMLLSDKGYDVTAIHAAENDSDIKRVIGGISLSNVIVIGNTELLIPALKGFNGNPDDQYFRHGDNNYVLMPVYDEQYIKDILIPVLNSKSKSFYNTIIFKTFGKTEQELKELLIEQVRNKHKIVFTFYPSLAECEIHIRYSSNTLSSTINEIVSKVGELVSPFTYAYSDISLTEQTIKQLVGAGKRISIAETFTRGGVAKQLSSGKNMDALLLESIVVNSEQSLKSRLGIKADVIARHGVLSDETAYIMAGNLFANPECDLALAVLGSSAPTGGEEDDNIFYIAVGNRNAIHVFTEHYFGDKNEIIEAGIKYALNAVNKFLCDEKSSAKKE